MRWSEAGFPETVAPLGTALTDTMRANCSGASPEPVLCFDGDTAGRRAAFRAVETALPLLKPGFSVRFAFLSDGLDPDDFIRQHGAAEFQAVLDTKLLPLFDVLIQREEQQKPAVTPSRGRHWRRGSSSSSPASPTQVCAASTSGVAGRPCGRRAASLSGEIARLAWATRLTLRGQAPRQHPLDPRVGGAGEPSARGWAACPASAVAGRGSPCAATSLPIAPSPLPARETLLIRTLLNHPWLLEARCEEVADPTFDLPAPRPPARRAARPPCP